MTMTKQEFEHFSIGVRGKLIALARRFNYASEWDGDEEDLVQEALMTLWQLLEKGYPVKDPEALAVKITKTRCVEKYRRRHIRYEPITDRLAVPDAPASSGTDQMDMDTIRGIVQRDLTESQIRLLTLRRDFGLSLDEIAAVTGRPKASIKVSLSVARKKMFEELRKMK